MSAMLQPADRSGRITLTRSSVSMSADSAMKCTPQNTTYSAAFCVAASWLSLRLSPVKSANWMTSSC